MRKVITCHLSKSENLLLSMFLDAESNYYPCNDWFPIPIWIHVKNTFFQIQLLLRNEMRKLITLCGFDEESKTEFTKFAKNRETVLRLESGPRGDLIT